MAPTLRLSELKVDDIIFSDPVVSNQATFINMSLRGHSGKLEILGPKLGMPFPPRKTPGENGRPDRIAVSASFDGHDTDPEVGAALANIRAIEAKLIDHVTAKATDPNLFGKVMSREVVAELCTTMLYHKPGTSYPPSITLRIQPPGSKKAVSQFINVDDREISYEDLPVRGCIAPIVTFSPYFVNKKFGISTDIVVAMSFGGGGPVARGIKRFPVDIIESAKRMRSEDGGDRPAPSGGGDDTARASPTDEEAAAEAADDGGGVKSDPEYE